jgi:hypothetical protein
LLVVLIPEECEIACTFSSFMTARTNNTRKVAWGGDRMCTEMNYFSGAVKRDAIPTPPLESNCGTRHSPSCTYRKIMVICIYKDSGALLRVGRGTVLIQSLYEGGGEGLGTIEILGINTPRKVALLVVVKLQIGRILRICLGIAAPVASVAHAPCRTCWVGPNGQIQTTSRVGRIQTIKHIVVTEINTQRHRQRLLLCGLRHNFATQS